MKTDRDKLEEDTLKGILARKVDRLREEEGEPINLHKPPIHVLHSLLTRSSKTSLFRSKCPFCEDGFLLCGRNLETFELRRLDRCINCAQAVIYDDDKVIVQGYDGDENFLRFEKTQ